MTIIIIIIIIVIIIIIIIVIIVIIRVSLLTAFFSLPLDGFSRDTCPETLPLHCGRYWQQVLTSKTQIVTHSLDTKTSESQCLLCLSEAYRAKQCSQYSDVATRQDRLTKIGLCSRCLQTQHKGKCPQSIICNTCHKGNHNEVFCYSNFKTKSQNVTKSDSAVKLGNTANCAVTEVDTVALSNQCTSCKHSSALATAKVNVPSNKNSKSTSVGCSFDPGSKFPSLLPS